MNVAIHQILSPWPIGIIAVGILMWWLIPWTLASRMTPKSSSRQRYEENLRTNIARTLTGMSVAVGFFVTIWQTNRTEQLATETRILDQYQKATETLGKNDYRIHSGAVSTLIEAARLRPELRSGAMLQLAQAALVYSGDRLETAAPDGRRCLPERGECSDLAGRAGCARGSCDATVSAGQDLNSTAPGALPRRLVTLGIFQRDTDSRRCRSLRQ